MLSLAFVVSATAVWVQTADVSVDAAGALRREDTSRSQPGDMPARMDVKAEGGILRMVFKDVSDKLASTAAPPDPLTQGVFLVASAVFLFLSVGIWAWVKRSAPPSALAYTSDPPAPGAGLADNFVIKRPIGMGGGGVVYEALDRALDRRVAVKKLREDIHADTAELERFLKEAKTVAGLHHPNIVDIHSVVNQGSDLYLVFEYVDGRSVEDLLRERKRLSLREVKAILGPVCVALQFAHERGVIHRDLKPGNIMISVEGLVKVMDFGIARKVRERAAPPPAVSGEGTRPPSEGFGPSPADETRTVIGTPMYMSPEAESGVVCRESDVYALGVMLYQMLTGQRPFPGGADLYQKLARDYPKASSAAPGLPARLDALVDSALEPDYTKRIHSAMEFWTLLAAL